MISQHLETNNSVFTQTEHCVDVDYKKNYPSVLQCGDAGFRGGGRFDEGGGRESKDDESGGGSSDGGKVYHDRVLLIWGHHVPEHVPPAPPPARPPSPYPTPAGMGAVSASIGICSLSYALIEPKHGVQLTKVALVSNMVAFIASLSGIGLKTKYPKAARICDFITYGSLVISNVLVATSML